jgi:hypothetical protein
VTSPDNTIEPGWRFMRPSTNHSYIVYQVLPGDDQILALSGARPKDQHVQVVPSTVSPVNPDLIATRTHLHTPTSQPVSARENNKTKGRKERRAIHQTL